jgi:hypothetical protein
LDVLHTHTLLEVASLFVQLQTPIWSRDPWLSRVACCAWFLPRKETWVGFGLFQDRELWVITHLTWVSFYGLCQVVCICQVVYIWALIHGLVYFLLVDILIRSLV